MSSTADLLVKIKGDTSGVDGKLSKLGGAFGTMGKAAVLGAGAAAVAVGAVGVKSLMAFADVDKGMREVFTLMPGVSNDAMSQMTDDVLGFSSEMGIATDTVIPALYSSISAGVPASNVFDFMEVAAKASIGGVTDLDTAVDGITSTVNAFGAGNITATEASDQMFTAVRLGKTTFEELSKSLFQVNPVAAGLGVQFGDVSASLAALTAQGVPTSVAATQVRGALVELGKDGTKASDTFKKLSGKSFKDFIKGGGDMKGAFDIMKAGADDMGVGVSDLFGSVEAGMAVLALTSESGSESFGNAMDEMQNSAGATEQAFNTMDGGMSRSWDKIKTAGANALATLGKKLAPFAEKFMTWFADKLPGAIDWLIAAFEKIYPTLETVGQWLSVAIPKAIDILVAYWKWLWPIVETVWNNIQGVIETVVGWFSSDATSEVGGTVDTISGYFQGFLDFIGPIWDGIVEVISVAVEVITEVVSLLVQGIQALWENHGERIMDTVTQIFTSVRDIIQGVMDVITGILNVIMGILTGDWSRAWDGIKQVVEGIWNIIVGIVEGAWAGLQAAISLGLDALGNLWGLAWNAIKTAVEGIWDGIYSFVSEKIAAVRDFIMERVEAIVSFWAEKWEAVKTKVSEIWEAILTFVSEKIEAVRTFVSEKLEAIRAFFAEKLEAARTIVTEKFEAIRAFVNEKINAAKTAVGTALEGIKTFFSDKLGAAYTTVTTKLSQIRQFIVDKIIDAKNIVRDTLRNIVSMFGEKFSEVVTTVRNKMKAAGDAIWEWINKGYAFARDIGVWVVKGIVNGLGGLFSAVYNKLKSGLTSAFNAAKRFFGIGSPSKWTEKFIGQPLAQGVDKGIDSIDFTSTLRNSLPDVGALGAIGGLGGRGGSVTIVVNIGEDEVARVLADTMRRDYIELDLDNDGWGVRT